MAWPCPAATPTSPRRSGPGARKLYYALLAGKRAIEDDATLDPAAVSAVMAAALARCP